MILDPRSDPLRDLNEIERFSGVFDILKRAGEVDDKTDPSDISDQDFEDFEAHVIELAKIDPVVFSQYVFQWPMQPIHVEFHDLISKSLRVVIWAPIEHGKTSQLSVARPIWELGKNPSLRIALISATASLAKKSLSLIKQQIDLNPRVRAVFPNLKPEERPKRMQSWTDTAIIVQRDDLANRDFSIQVLGIDGAIMGARLDWIHIDDVLDQNNTLRESQREKVIAWFNSTVEGRSTAYGRISVIGTAWHRKDLMHVLAKQPTWKSKRFDATEKEYWPDFLEVDGKPCGWPKWRLEAKRKALSVLEFNRQFRNLPLSEASEIFNSMAIEACFIPGMRWDPMPEPWMQFYVGVDLNVQKSEAHDKTSFFIGRPDGEKRIVHRIIAENMNLEDIAFWFYYIEARYHPVIFLVENNAAQDYVVQLFNLKSIQMVFTARGEDPDHYRGLRPRVQGFTTGKNKADPQLGLRGMTIEFEQKRWEIPDHPLTRQWKDELIDFDPLAHPPDILMSSWFFHSATMKYRPKRLRARTLSTEGR